MLVISVLFQYILSSYAHMLYVRAPFPLFLHIHGSSDSLDLHIQICGYVLLIRYLERITGILRNMELSLFVYQYSFLTFISVDSLFSTYITFSYYFIPLFICYHVWSLICYYSDIDLS